MNIEIEEGRQNGRWVDIIGKRIILQEIRPNDEDLNVLLAWRNLNDFQEKCLSFSKRLNMDELYDEINHAYSNDRLVHFIARNQDKEPIGTSWIYRYSKHNGIAYTTTFVSPENRFSRYYGIEMFLLACNYLFTEKNCRKVYSEVHSDNSESKLIFEKLGISLEAELKSHTVLNNGDFCDLLIYALYKEEFLASNFVRRFIK